MATQLASQHQPVRVIRGAGSTPPIAQPGPGSQAGNPAPHAGQGKRFRNIRQSAYRCARLSRRQHSAGRNARAWPATTQRSPPRARLMVPGRVGGWPTRSAATKQQYPGIRTVRRPDRSNRSGCSRLPSGTQQLGMQNGYTRLAPVLGPITDGEEEHPSSGARSPIRCLSSEPALSDAVRPEDRFWRAWYVQFVHRGLLMTSASWVRDLIWSLR